MLHIEEVPLDVVLPVNDIAMVILQPYVELRNSEGVIILGDAKKLFSGKRETVFIRSHFAILHLLILIQKAGVFLLIKLLFTRSIRSIKKPGSIVGLEIRKLILQEHTSQQP